MTTKTTIYAPPAPEYGDRFQRMWADYNTRDRLGASEASYTCPMCGYDHEAEGLAQTHYATDLTLAEAEKHYGKHMCCHCFENLTTCAVCSTKRRQTDMTPVGHDDANVCSAYCEDEWNEPSIAADNRLTLGDVM
jgi:hypothetical protein